MTAGPPKVFVSATSKDLGSVRLSIKEALLTMGCHPVEQVSFPPGEYFQTVTDRLRELIQDCEAVVHVAGMRYGAEPRAGTQPAGAPRRSYTQMEVELAQELKKRLYIFICPPDFPYEFAHREDPEPEDLQQLQIAWRDHLSRSGGLYTKVEDQNALNARVRELQIELGALKRRVAKNSLRLTLSIAVAAVSLLLVAGGIGWVIRQQQTQQKSVEEVRRAIEADPDALAERLRKQIRERAEAAIEKKEGDWVAIRDIEMARDRQLGKVEDLIRTLREDLSKEASPVFTQAAAILTDKKRGGPDQALAYLEVQRNGILSEVDRLAALESEIEQRKRETLRPLVLEAQIHENRLEWDGALTDLRLVEGKTTDWWEAHHRLGKLLRERAMWDEASVHLQQALGLAEGNEERALSLSELGLLHLAKGQYPEAEPRLREALEIGEKALGRDGPATLEFRNDLAELLRMAGRYVEAEPLYTEAVEAQERVLGADHPDTLATRNSLAGLFKDLGHYDKAEALYRETLKSRERTLGRDHPDTLISINDLAVLLQLTGAYTEAESLSREAWATSEKVRGAEHPETLTAVSNLASLLANTMQFDEAEKLHREVLETRKRVLGEEHPDTLMSAARVATTLRERGETAEAETMFREVVRAQERVLGREHPETLLVRGALADLLQSQRQEEEAAKLHSDVLEIRERLLGRTHPDTLSSINSLALVRAAQKRYPEAEPLLREVFHARGRMLGNDHPLTLIAADNLAYVLKESGKFSESEPLYREIVERLEKTAGSTDPETLTARDKLAGLFQAQGNSTEAERLLRDVLEIRERVLGARHRDTLATIYSLAFLLQTEKRSAEAEPLYRKAWEGLADLLGEDHPNTLIVKKHWDICRAVAKGLPAESAPEAPGSR